LENQPGTSQTSDLERELREAHEAQAEAEAALQRAAVARAEAESAQRRAREEQEASRRAWAQSVVDTYDSDLAAAETAIRDASDRFAESAVRDIAAAVAAYMDWVEASLRHYTLQVRVATVAPLVGLEATPGEQLSPPPFAQALDAAIDLHIAALSSRIRDEAADEIRARLGDTIELQPR
jgi:small-conductance mechanosensitive channel